MLKARSEKTADGKQRVQTLREHSLAVSEMAGEICEKIGLENAGVLDGILHDSGKSPIEWQDYMMKGLHDKIVPHSLPGAAFLIQEAGAGRSGGDKRLLQMLALSIHGHHGGLRDVLTPDGESCIPDYAAAQPDVLRGIEGEGANRYFGVLDELILQNRDDFFFHTRSPSLPARGAVTGSGADAKRYRGPCPEEAKRT